MSICGVTRLLVPASFAWIAVSAISGREVHGLIAALLTAGVLFGVGKVRGTDRACALPVAPGPARDRGPSGDLTAP